MRHGIRKSDDMAAREKAGPSALPYPAGDPLQRCLRVRGEPFAFTQYVEVVFFKLGRPSNHLGHVVGYIEVAAGKGVGRSRCKIDHQGGRAHGWRHCLRLRRRPRRTARDWVRHRTIPPRTSPYAPDQDRWRRPCTMPARLDGEVLDEPVQRGLAHDVGRHNRNRRETGAAGEVDDPATTPGERARQDRLRATTGTTAAP
jgi:hypothetical protein